MDKRLTRPEPTIDDRLSWVESAAELDGFRDQIKAEGRMTTDIQAAIARKRVSLQSKR